MLKPVVKKCILLWCMFKHEHRRLIETHVIKESTGMYPYVIDVYSGSPRPVRILLARGVPNGSIIGL